MIDAETGSGYAGTDWACRDVVQIWQAIENQDTAANYELLTGWRRSHELVWQHLEHVQDYRENLAAAWPPAKSAAAAAYIERLDHLIAHLQDTYRAAVTNHQVLYATTLAIAQARTNVQAIYNEYASNQAKLEEYRTAQPTIAFRTPKPPVPDGRQEELNYRARAIMFGLSNELLQARDQITNPPHYDPSLSRTGTKSNVPEGNRPPTVTNSTSGVSTVSRPSGFQQAVQSPIATSGVELSSSHSNDIRQPGLVLSGLASSATSIVPATDLAATPPAAAIRGTLPTGGTAPALLPLVMPNPQVQLPRNNTSSLPKDPLGRQTMEAMKTGASHVMAPGGVIGSVQPIRRSQATGTRPPQRVNPIGGLISSSESGNAKTANGRSMSSSSPQTAWTGTRHVGRPDELEDRQLWDPNNPWETADGVDPVVLPVKEQHMDPGPAIGLA